VEKFLNIIAARVVAAHGNNMGRVAMVLPNHRSCIYFRQALLDKCQGTVWLPEITTLTDWVLRNSKLALIEPLEQVLILHEVYKNNGGTDTADEFMHTARTMLSDFNELDREMTNAGLLFKNLELLKSMNVYVPGEDVPTEYSIQYRAFWKMFRELYFAFRQSLLEQGKGYEGMIYRDVAENIDGIIKDSSIQQYYFAGFSWQHKTDEKIIDHLFTRGKATVWNDADIYYTEAYHQEAGDFFRKQNHAWKKQGNLLAFDLLGIEPKKIEIIGVAKNMGQAKVTADIIQNKLKLTKEEEKETAIIVLDEKLLQPLLASMPQTLNALNISMGVPLSDTQANALMQVYFSLFENFERFNKPGSKQLRFYYRDVFDILLHPYTAYFIEDAVKVGEFIHRIKRFNRMVITFKELQENLGEMAELLFPQPGSALKVLAHMINLFSAIRQKATGEEDATKKLSDSDIEVIYRLHNILQNTANVLGDNNDLSIKSLRTILVDEVRSNRVPFEGEPVKGLQILGMQETQCLDFKNVIILSLNEGVYPKSKTERTYLPHELRKEFLTTYKERDAFSAYLFYRLLQRAENIYMLYNTEADELGGGEKSRFILQLQHELAIENKHIKLEDKIYSVDPDSTLAEDPIIISKNEQVMEKLRGNAAYGISPSAINTYVNCTLQYYFRYVAGMREVDDIEESIEANTLGSAVHYVLEYLYKDVVNKPLTVPFIESCLADKARLNKLLRESFKDRFDDEALRTGKNYLYYKVCLKLVEEFLKHEKQLIQELDAQGKVKKVLMLENEMGHELSINGWPVRVMGKVDRVEDVGGITHVADYKTGKVQGGGIKSDDISLVAADPKYSKALQLLTYAWLYSKQFEVTNLSLRSGIYWLRNIAKSYDTLKIDKSDIINSTQINEFEEVLSGILSQLYNPEIPFQKTEDINRCVHCEFVRICRRD
jgi:ATP-dependent helicase/nuclease subunit B